MLKKIQKYHWFALVTAFGVSVVGWTLVLSQPVVYEARADVLAGLRVEGKIEPIEQDAAFNFDNLSGIDKPQYDIEKIADRSDGSLFRIRYRGNDQQKVIAHLSTTLEVYARHVREQVERARLANEIDGRLTEYSQMRSAAFEKLVDFETRNAGLLPDDYDELLSRFSTETTKLGKMRLAIETLANTLRELRLQIEKQSPYLREGPASSGQVAYAGSAIVMEIDQLELQRAGLLLSIGESGADVRAIDDKLEKLYRRRAEAEVSLRELSAGPLVESYAGNEAYRGAKIAINEAEVRWIKLHNELQTQQVLVERLKQALAEVPNVEARYAPLLHNYESADALYTTLLISRERQQLRLQAKEPTISDLQIISAPATLGGPLGSSRSRAFIAVFLGGVTAGFAVVFWSQRRQARRLSYERSVRESGQPVMRAIARIKGAAETDHNQETNLRFLMASSVFVALFFCLLFYESSLVELTQRIVAEFRD